MNCHWLFVLHELPLMHHKLSLIVLEILYLGADGSSSHVMPTWVGLCDSGHILLHAGVTLRFTTCLKSYRPYGAPLPHPSSSPNGVASRHREEEQLNNPFMTDLCKICFKKNIHFISNHLSDSKRQQTTAVDYKHLINGLVLTRFASLQHNRKNIENGRITTRDVWPYLHPIQRQTERGHQIS